MNIKKIPNMLSALRVILVPVFVVLFAKKMTTAAVVVFVFSGLTDVLDGYIARKYECISNLGKLLDPFADKLTQFSAFICLYLSDLVPLWMPVVYFFKELATLIGAIVVFKKGKVVVKSHTFGKLATVFVYAFVVITALFGEAIPREFIVVLCIAMCLYFLFSCLMYANTEVRRGVKGDDR